MFVIFIAEHYNDIIIEYSFIILEPSMPEVFFFHYYVCVSGFFLFPSEALSVCVDS